MLFVRRVHHAFSGGHAVFVLRSGLGAFAFLGSRFPWRALVHACDHRPMVHTADPRRRDIKLERAHALVCFVLALRAGDRINPLAREAAPA